MDWAHMLTKMFETTDSLVQVCSQKIITYELKNAAPNLLKIWICIESKAAPVTNKFSLTFLPDSSFFRSNGVIRWAESWRVRAFKLHCSLNPTQCNREMCCSHTPAVVRVWPFPRKWGPIASSSLSDHCNVVATSETVILSLRSTLNIIVIK